MATQRMQLALTVIGSTGVDRCRRGTARSRARCLRDARTATSPHFLQLFMTDSPDLPTTADAKPQRGINALDSTGDLLRALVAARRGRLTLARSGGRRRHAAGEGVSASGESA